MYHFCTGCYSCIEDETACPFWDDKKPFIDAMEKADVMIFTTPTYCLAPTGAMKSFLDLCCDLCMIHRPKPWMFRKRAVILSASAGSPCRKTIRTVRDSLDLWGVPCVTGYGTPVRATSWEGVSPDIKAKIDRALDDIAAKIKAGAETGRPPHASLKMRIMFLVIRKLHASGWDASPKEKEYWESHGWLGSVRPWRS
jgi:NAD(P)H-dependent FMN reductase